MLLVLAAPPLAAPSPAAAALRTAADLHAEAAKALAAPEADAKAARLRLRSALALRERHLGRVHPLSLATRGLFGLLLDREGDPRGLKLYAEACGELHRLLRAQERAQGRDSPELLGCLEALTELYGFEQLKAARWEDRALPIRVRHSKGVQPELERRVVAALERHYGPWLSFRPTDTEAVLGDVARLLELWSRREDPVNLTRTFAETAFRGDAKGVWEVVAGKGDEALANALVECLERLDPGILEEQFDGFQAWLEGQKGRPWEAEARRLGQELSRLLERWEEGLNIRRRARLAEALGDPGSAASILAQAIRSAEEPKELESLLDLATGLQERTGGEALEAVLNEAGLARRSELLDRDQGRRWLAGLADRLESRGRAGAAEDLWRSLLDRALQEDLGPPGAPVLAWRLGRNLAGQGRREEARYFLQPLLARDLPEGARLRFLLAELEAAQGQAEVAGIRAQEGLDRFLADGNFRPVPGLAAALRRLERDGPSADLRAEILRQLAKQLDPTEAFTALKDPARLLVLVERLETPQAPASVPCDGPWAQVAEGPLERAEALQRAARELTPQEALPCRRAALRLLEGLWGSGDPRLAEPLLGLGRSLAEAGDPGAERLLRRVLELGRAHPDLDPALRIETLARLGQLLAEKDPGTAADGFFRQALGLLDAVSPAREETERMVAGVCLVLLVRLEEVEDYLGALAVLEEADALGARHPAFHEEFAKDAANSRPQLLRKARLQALLRAQGLP